MRIPVGFTTGVLYDVAPNRACVGMPIRNKIKALAELKGDDTNYKFWKRTGLPRSTAYRVYPDPTAYPSESVLAAICEAYSVQPGDCLEYISETGSNEEKKEK
jgi:hypothetical protein